MPTGPDRQRRRLRRGEGEGQVLGGQGTREPAGVCGSNTTRFDQAARAALWGGAMSATLVVGHAQEHRVGRLADLVG